VSLFELCQWLQDTQVGIAINESAWVFPIILSIHALGTTLSAGTLVWFDLRLIGLKMRQQPVSEVYRQIGPWMIVGFFIMFITGGLLFLASAARLYEDVFFRIKFAALVAACVNAVVYHVFIRRTISEWDKAPIPPTAPRMAGLVSLVFWTATIVSGRLIFS
jgi:hypothetical protein